MQVLRAAHLLHQSTGPRQLQAVVAHDVFHHFPFQRGPFHFFDATSCRIALSRLSSATSFFSRAFSFLQDLQLTHAFHLHAGVLLFPAIERLLRNAQLAHDIAHGNPYSTCLRIKIISSAEYRFGFMVALLFLGKGWTKTHPGSCPVLPGQINWCNHIKEGYALAAWWWARTLIRFGTG